MAGSTRELRASRKLTLSLLSSAAGIAVLAMPQTAFAQAGPEDGASAEDDGVIIVSARKQDETLQEVPVTITSVGADTIQKYNISDPAAVVSRVPSLNVQVGGSGSGGLISLRGVGSSSISASFDSAVAFDYDGVQVSTMRMVQSGFVDTAQIDVLKGPQSLFFGKSASAGVLSIRSADPTPQWEVGGKASYEFEEKGWLVGGYISGPLTDTLGIRVAAEYNPISAYVRLQPGTPATNHERELNNTLARLTLDWKPVDGLSANLKVQYTHNTNDGAIGTADVYCGKNGAADPIVLFPAPDGSVPFTLVIPAGYDCNAFDGRYFLPDTAPPLSPSVPTASGPTKALGFNGVPFGVTDLWFGRLKLDFGLTDKVTLSSVTGYVNLDATDLDNYSYAGVGPAFTPLAGLGVTVADIAPALAAINGAGVPLGVGVSDPRNALKQFSQEFRLTTKLSNRVNFMVGAYYEWRKFIFDTAQNAFNIALIAPDPFTGYTFDWDKVHTTKTEATSFFGSAIINLTDQLELSGGVRYTKETKTQTISIPYVHYFLELNPLFVQGGYFSGPIPFKDSNWSPEVTLKYQVNPDINVFASYKTGFKSGGIDNSALPTNSLSEAALSGDFSALKYKSETAKGGEIGIKSQFNNRSLTLNATAFYYKFKNLQVQVFDPVAINFVTTNAGEVTNKGAELGWSWRTPQEGLSLSGTVAYLDSRYSSDYFTFTGENLNHRERSFAPHFSGNVAFDWKVPISDGLEFGLGGNALYNSRQWTTNTSRNDFIQPAYWTFDASASIGHPDGLWKLSLIANDLTDKLWVTSTGGRPFQAGANPFGIAPGDDVIVTQNRGRQVFVQGSFKF